MVKKGQSQFLLFDDSTKEFIGKDIIVVIEILPILFKIM